MTDLGPTRERMRKGSFQAPIKDQKTDRTAYRALSALAVLLQRSEIEPPHYEAAIKFNKHMLGSLGYDVRWGSGSPVDSIEFPQTYHAQMLAKAREHLTPREFQIVERITADEATPVSIGFGLSGHGTHQQAKPYGVSAINSALDRLAYFWGFKRRE